MNWVVWLLREDLLIMIKSADNATFKIGIVIPIIETCKLLKMDSQMGNEEVLYKITTTYNLCNLFSTLILHKTLLHEFYA